ncbi:PTS sugar transporter subunit IIC [Bacillus circulans]|jgi:fructoselysine/glucoselysine PTS system EIIC component|uniref:PTS mannose/fructose/sorbose/N-acetylgalactosamine transporter subunit IIC n=1 Tax=Niallia circulans TaxID=1397 RepID=UPI0002EF6BF2|nr:PTS sugar transporter subunit IIC [Niallia circulans]NRG28888.1 PTS sugar transporter subunit IIC [Niallia circulans]
MLMVSILLALVTMLVVFEWTLGTNLLSRPIVTGVLTGLVMGDIKTGIIMGATLELAFIGAFTIGAARPPDTVSGGILGTAFAISTGQGAEVALALAFPIAALFLIIDNLLTIFILPMFARKADRYAEEGNLKGIARMHILGGIIIKSIPRGILVGIAFYLGSPVMEALLNRVPDFVQTGITIATGILPALGFGLLLQMILKKEVVVFYLLGFALVAFLKIPVLGIAILAGIIAYILVGIDNKITISHYGEGNSDAENF